MFYIQRVIVFSRGLSESSTKTLRKTEKNIIDGIRIFWAGEFFDDFFGGKGLGKRLTRHKNYSPKKRKNKICFFNMKRHGDQPSKKTLL